MSIRTTEVFGEVEPALDMAHAEVIPAGGTNAATTNATSIYEYWWTIGQGGSKPQHRHLFEGRAKLDLWRRLEDVAARVYLYFPNSGGWRVQELAASAKYLSPIQRQADWTDKAAQEWQRMQPLLAGARQTASALGVVPGVATVAVGAAPILSAIAKLQVGTVPQGVKGFDWYVEKVTVPAARSHGVMQGVVWVIPKGDVRASWRPANRQPCRELHSHSDDSRGRVAAATASGPRPRRRVCRRRDSWVPAQNQFVELLLSPKAPATSA